MSTTIRVLYVDDERDLLELGKLYLELAGDFAVTTITNAPEAIRLLEQERFDAIISDYQMPGMDGIQFLVEVRTRFGQIPFILFTGRGREEVVIQAINSGADFYLQKGGEPKAQFAELSHKIKSAASRKMADDALRESEEKYQVIVDHALEAIMIIDSSANVLFANPAAATLVDIEDSSSCIGKNALEIIAPESREAARADLASSQDGRDGYVAQYKIITATARERWVELIGKRIVFGSIPAVIVMFRDITDRKRADLLIRESEEKFRTLLQNINDGVVVHELHDDGAGKIIEVNDRFCEITGYTRDELLQLSITDLDTPERQAQIPETMQQLADKKHAIFETEHRIPDGRRVPIEVSVSIFNLQGKPVGLSTVRNITDRKRAEDAIRESHDRFKVTIASLDDAVILVDPATRLISECNEATTRIFGYSHEELVGRETNFLHVDQAHLEQFGREANATYENPGYYTREFEMRRKDGRVFPTEHFVRPVRDPDGRTLYVVSVVRDITKRKRAADTIALTNRKLVLINDVTYQYIQNKLTGLSGYTKLIKDAKTDAERFSFIEKEERILADIYQLIKNTQEYQKIELIRPRWIPVEQSIRVAVSLVHPKQGISVETALPGLELYFDPIIEKVFAKLIDNAVKHGKSVTRITFSCKETPDGLILICEDDGVGISPAVKARLFDRLVSEKIRFGLFFVRECLTLSGMTIAETGTPGKGARFEITVPKGAWRMNPDTGNGHGGEI